MSSEYTVNDLRRHLFEAMENLATDKIDIEKANAISNLAQTIVNTGKLECQFINAIGGHGTGFIPNDNALPSRDQLKLVNKYPR